MIAVKVMLDSLKCENKMLDSYMLDEAKHFLIGV